MTERTPRSAPELISVVIPVLNGAESLPAQLEALAGQSYRGAWEVLVADNGSTDGTVEVALAWADRLPQLRVVHATERRSTNHARNVGAAAARGDFLAFCDADDVATPGWLEAMARAAPGGDLVGGRCDDGPLNDPVTRSWRLPMPPDRLPTVLGFLPYATSANLGIHADVLRALGGWNEDYVRGGTEVELCWRAQLASYRLCFAPDAVMLYRHRSGLSALARQLYIYGRAEPRLFHDFRWAGVPSKRLRGAVRSWGWIVLHLPDLLVSPKRRGVWVRRAAFSLGCLRGSLRYRVLCL